MEEIKRSSSDQQFHLKEALTPKLLLRKRVVWKIKNLFTHLKDFSSRGKNLQPALVEERCKGYNIVYFDGRYYALPQLEGAFDIKRFRQGRYKNVLSVIPLIR